MESAGIPDDELDKMRDAIQYSDNTASNLLMKILGGPAAVTTFARSIGDSPKERLRQRQFRLDCWKTALNSSISGVGVASPLENRRDTSTPNAMGLSLQRLAFGDALELNFPRKNLFTKELGGKMKSVLSRWRSLSSGESLIPSHP